MSHTFTMIVVAVAVLTVGALVGMNNDDGSGSDMTPTTSRTLTADDDGTALDLSTGDTLIVALDGNPTTGYAWEAWELDETVLRLVGEPTHQPSGDQIGAGGTTTFTFEAIAPGEVELRLVYHRPWETADPIDTFTVAVSIG